MGLLMNDHTRNLKALMTLSLSISTLGIINIISLSSSSSPFSSFHYAYTKKDQIGNPLVYHLSSDEPWRATAINRSVLEERS
ncbi:MAG TPA: hypothetical protein VI278_13275 [Nitrososphaeraceae archaeon]|jgi:hypothetical protein